MHYAITYSKSSNKKTILVHDRGKGKVITTRNCTPIYVVEMQICILDFLVFKYINCARDKIDWWDWFEMMTERADFFFYCERNI